MPSHTEFLADQLMRHQAHLHALVQREAGAPLLRFETVDDLVQGIQHEALRSAGQFAWQGEAAFIGWLSTIARRHLANRRDYWFAIKRNSARILRLTWYGRGDRTAVRHDLADTSTGPITFAHRREQLALVTKALSLLLPRDREIVQWTAAGLTLEELAGRLNLSTESAERARSRAFERLRKIFEVMGQGKAKS